MTDDEIVNLLGMFLLTNNEVDAFKRARDLHSYLRKAGCEVVVWQENKQENWRQLKPDEHTVWLKDNEEGRYRWMYDAYAATHFCTLTGPESNNG